MNAEFTLEAGQSASFEFHGLLDRNEEQIGLSDKETDELFHDTVEYWRRWISRSNYHGRWREMVNRSALALKLLTFQPTGAIVAAPTCSLPETIGGAPQLGLPLHLDSRRGVHAVRADAPRLHRGGDRVHVLARRSAAMRWSRTARCRSCTASMGGHDLREETLDHLEGYKGSRSGAHRQRRV